MQKKLGVTVFVSDKLVHVIQHGLQGFIVKISKVSQQRQMILVFVEVGLLRK